MDGDIVFDFETGVFNILLGNQDTQYSTIQTSIPKNLATYKCLYFAWLKYMNREDDLSSWIA